MTGLFRFTGFTRQPPTPEERAEIKAAVREFGRALARMHSQRREPRDEDNDEPEARDAKGE